MQQQDKIFKLLSSDVKRRIISELCRQPRYVSELAGILNTSQPAVSRHLKPLFMAGVVYRKDDAKPEEVGERHVFALQPKFNRIKKIIDLAEQISA